MKLFDSGSNAATSLFASVQPRPRPREYATIIAGAVCCAVAGALFDQLTVSVSPEYFTMGKGVPPDSLRWGSAVTGFYGGLPLGALCTGVFLWLRESGRAKAASRFAALCALSVVPAALLAVAVMLMLDPFAVRLDASGILSASEANRYLTCWGIHVGAYVGPIVTVAASVRK